MYRTFHECSESLANVRAIDYFFAKEIMSQINCKYKKFINTNQDILFHLIMKLMYDYSSGHSCIKICDLGDELLFSDKEESENKQGFQLPNYMGLVNILEQLDYANLPIHFEKEFDSLYIKRLWLFEKEIANFIKANISNNSNQQLVENIVNKLFDKSEEIDWQKKAVVNTLSRNFSIISGGPGTGKTTTVAKLILALQMLGEETQRIALLAPTGKAAQRMTESLKDSIDSFRNSLAEEYENVYQQKNNLTELQGQTIHRFLGLKPNSSYVKYNKKTKAPYNVIIVDEASMLDINIFVKLIRAIGKTAKLVLIGDVNQLPSVEAGNLLASFTESLNQNKDASYVVKLLRNYRSQKYINNLANDVLNEYIDMEEYQDKGLHFFNLKKIDSLLKKYTEKYKKIAASKNSIEALDLLKRFRILVANKNLEIGTDKLNQKIEKLLGKPSGSIYKGKPIMITQNSYSQNLFNGDTGIIWPDSNGILRAYFDGKDKAFSLSTLPQWETVYVMTIHKTQGSEFDEVAIILPREDNDALNKQLLYTGITRAKSKLSLICNISVLKDILKKHSHRNSNINRLIFSK